MAVTAGSSSSRPAKKAKEGLVRHDSGQSSSRATPVSSTEGDYDDEDEEEEDDDDVEDEEEEGEEEEGAPDSVRFDEQFLAQLLAFDSSLAGQSNTTGTSSRSQANNYDAQQEAGVQSTALPPNSYSTDPITRHTPSNSTSLPFSAPTPSNEFYDGAINFLTEVLGSSTPNFWNGGANLAQPSWPGHGSTPTASVGAVDFTAPAKTDFRNLQPLISNLIARLKGFPIQEGQQIGQTLEDDLVTLLQSLMAHRQAQQNRQVQEQLDQSINMLHNAQHSGVSSAVLDPSASASTSALPDNGQAASMMNSQTLPAQPGFSFVDFDFGDDDDDPDFIPKNVNLDFASSTEFADALAQVSAAPVAPLPEGVNGADKTDTHLNVDDESWQQVMNALQARDEDGNKGGKSSFPSPWEDNGKSRRTRSTTRNLEMTEGETQLGAEQGDSPALARGRSQSGGADYDRGDSYESDHDEAGRGGEKKRGRKALSKEEALERRRESNRECSRRSRLRKKQEEEEIRQEFVRIQQLRLASQESQDLGKDDVSLPAGLRKKKKGRPFGSKSYANRGENGMISLGEHSEQVADLKADNRMLRAEMQRLIEENAQLRARMLRVEEEGPAAPASSRLSRVYDESKYAKERLPQSALRNYRSRTSRNVDRNRYHDDDDDEESMSDETDGFHARSQASRYLPYDPTKPFKPPVTSRKSFPEQSSDGKANKRKRNDDNGLDGPTPSIEQLLRGFAAYQQSSNAPQPPLPDSFPSIPTQQRARPNGLM